MAKKAMINKELKRAKLAAAGKYPVVRLHNRCSICGRPHGFHRDFGLCRICLRKMAQSWISGRGKIAISWIVSAKASQWQTNKKKTSEWGLFLLYKLFKIFYIF